MLCTKCFNNHGLRQTASGLSRLVAEPCPNCGRNGGVLLNEEQLLELMTRFFVYGSSPTNTGGFAPIFMFNESQYPGSVTFESSLQFDLILLSETLKVGLFHYGPPLWRIGYTNHYDAFLDDDKNEKTRIVSEIMNRCQHETLGPNNLLFRGRKNIIDKENPNVDFDTPPLGLQNGRYGSPNFPVLYLSEDVETCIHECKVTLADEFLIAALKPTKNLNLLNMADKINDTEAHTPFESIQIFLDGLAFSGEVNYETCRFISKMVKESGFDGFVFGSYYNQATKRKFRNIALFDFPIREGLLEVQSINSIRLANVEYNFRFGPSMYETDY